MRLYRNLILMMAGFLILASGCKSSGSKDAVNPLYNSKSQPSSEQSAQFIVPWMKQLYNFLRTEKLAPTDASRTFAYIGTVIYEAQICGAPDYLTLENQFNGLTDLPRPNKEEVYDWTTVTIEGIYYVQDEMLARYLPAGVSTINDLHNQQIDERAKTIPADVMERSKKYGRELADAIISWSEGDNYEQTRYMQFKTPSREGHPEYWEPTDFNQTAFEPFWGTHRTFAVKNATQCDINMKFEYSDDSTSEMYKQAKEVWMTDKHLTEEQRTIAQFWADDAGETMTPPGHWLVIIDNFNQSEKMTLDRAAELYALTSAAMADACITLWQTKYRVNLLRPKTYINEHFEKGWEPYVETPGFPGYTSGHSGFSGAAASILDGLIGQNVPFIDSTHVMIGLLPRKFESFDAAAKEAAFSRMYGGIHYTCEIEDGGTQGRCIGDYILSNIITHPKRQGQTSNDSKKDMANSEKDKQKSDPADEL